MSMDYRKYMDDDTCSGRCDKCRCGKKIEIDSTEGLTDQDIAELADMLLTAIAEHLRDEAVTCRCEKLGELRKKYGEDARLVILADPAKGYRICTEEACREELFDDDDYDSETIDTIFDEALFVGFNDCDIATLGGTRYLTGRMMIFEVDEDGNEISITPDTIRSFFDFVEISRTLIEVDGKNFPAFRLD